MAGYNPKSCNALQKPYYRPIEVAIRWCGLIDYEAQILDELEHSGLYIPAAGQFPKWPCLRVNTEKIFDAMAHGEIPIGRDGCTVSPNVQVTPSKRTVRHTDLRVWMAKHYPDQKPEFLFDEVERSTHSSINAESYKVLQADRDALGRQLQAARESIEQLELGKYASAAKIKQYEERLKHLGSEIDPRSEKTYLNIIGALLEVLTGTFKDECFSSETQLREFISEKFDGFRGVAARTLADKFALAKKAINDEDD